MGKLIKIQWIPSHIIPENDIADKMAKTAFNWQTVWEFFSREWGKCFKFGQGFSNYRIDFWKQVRKFFKDR